MDYAAGVTVAQHWVNLIEFGRIPFHRNLENRYGPLFDADVRWPADGSERRDRRS